LEANVHPVGGFLTRLNGSFSVIKLTSVTPSLLIGQMIRSQTEKGEVMDYTQSVPLVFVSFTPDKVI
jgi:hypothetical protein